MAAYAAVSVGPMRRASLDPASHEWVSALTSSGEVRAEALSRLHDLLLRAARFEVARRRTTLQHLGADELDDIALQSADDALVALLAKLDQFRGQSRFTTWAYKFAVLEASVKLRRRPWHGRELPLDGELAGGGESSEASPSVAAERGELVAAVTAAIATELTTHQREVLVAVTLNDVPIDVLAERLNTSRGAVYKTIHDARRKLRERLAADGHELPGDGGPV